MSTVHRPIDFDRLRGVRDAVLQQRDRSWILVGNWDARDADEEATADNGGVILGTLTDATIGDVVTLVECWFADMDGTASSRPPQAGDSAAWDVVWG